MEINHINIGDVKDILPGLPSESAQMCVTSPPYWGLRDYGVDGQLGLEKTPEEYVAKMVDVFREVRRVLKDDGTCWVNMGDSYWNGGAEKRDGGHGFVDGGKVKLDAALGAVIQRRATTSLGLKPKDVVGMPWRVAFALQADGWYLRQDIIWSKPNPMPESVTDRCTKAHEYMFLLSKAPRYYFDAEAIAEQADTAGKIGGFTGYQAKAKNVAPSGNQIAEKGRQYVRLNNRNKRSVWTVPSQPYSEAHFATFPEKLIEPCILAGSRPGDVVLDPFFGSGTTGQVCERLGRQWIGIELNPDYAEMAERRTSQMGLSLG